MKNNTGAQTDSLKFGSLHAGHIMPLPLYDAIQMVILGLQYNTQLLQFIPRISEKHGN